MRKQVAVFRQQLFKLSESFITEQVRSLRKYEPIYVGRERHGNHPAGSDVLCLSDESRFSLSRKSVHLISGSPNKYLDILQGRQPRLIHAHFGVDAMYALPVSRELRIPLVTTFHGFDATTSLRALLLSRSISLTRYGLLRGRLAAEGRLFLCVSKAIQRRVLDLGFPESNVMVHYIGIDVGGISIRAQRPTAPTVLHVGRLVEKKGTDHLLRAFLRVSEAVPDARLRIVGDGPWRAKLSRLADELGIAARVHFAGARSRTDVLNEIRKAAVMAIPSVTARNGDSEGLPTVLLEAAACGVPVVGTFHSGIPEAIVDGKTGCLVPEAEPRLLADRLIELLRSPGESWAMGMAARKLVEQQFDLNTQTEDLEKLYDAVA